MLFPYRRCRNIYYKIKKILKMGMKMNDEFKNRIAEELLKAIQALPPEIQVRYLIFLLYFDSMVQDLSRHRARINPKPLLHLKNYYCNSGPYCDDNNNKIQNYHSRNLLSLLLFAA